MLYVKYMDIVYFVDDECCDEVEVILQFLILVCKVFMIDIGLEFISLGIQVFGGYGYICEWGME